MPALVQYLLKLFVSLSAIYLFYQFVLRRLTFYNWNRFYLFCYTAISFLIPFINITPVLERNDIANNHIIRLVPSVENINANLMEKLPAKSGLLLWTSWDWLLFFVLTGIVLMLVRLFIQLISFKRIINQARLVSGSDVKLYQVNQQLMPFSFGNSIFINQQLHNDDELSEIIRHEFVHVKQKHTTDIIWAELLCILNWYNPFVWLIRKAIRQNLEFIADNKVLQSGFDKKEYQYLLLKVIGNNHFSIAPNFNFSSLKKRIAMMNKMKSAKLHLVKFLFVLPLMAILVLSFRSRMNRMASSPTTISERFEKVFKLSGIVYDNTTGLPLPGVTMIDPDNEIQTKTDENGFYKITIPIQAEKKQRITFKFFKDGYNNNDRLIELDAYGSRSCLGFFSLLSIGNAGEKMDHAFFYSAKDSKGNGIVNPGYDLVKDRFENYFKKKVEASSFYEKGIYSIEDMKLEELRVLVTDTIPGNGKINSNGYILDIIGVKENCTVLVKDKDKKEQKSILLTEWNKRKEYYENLYGTLPIDAVPVKSDVIVLSVDTDSTVAEKRGLTYTVSEKPVHKANYKSITLEADGIAAVLLKDGQTIRYNLNDEIIRRSFEEKYGGEIVLRNNSISPVTVTGVKSNNNLTPVTVAGKPIDARDPKDPLKEITVVGVKKDNQAPGKLEPVTVTGVPHTALIDAPGKEDKLREVVVTGYKMEPAVLADIVFKIDNSISEKELKGIANDAKRKGFEFKIDKTTYNNGKLSYLKGTLEKNGLKKSFTAVDFLEFVVMDNSNQGANDFNFWINGGSLVWE